MEMVKNFGIKYNEMYMMVQQSRSIHLIYGNF